MSKSSFCINPKSKQITELSNKLGVDPIFLALKADVWSYTTKLPITEDNWEEVKSFILDKLNIGKILDTDNKEYFDNLNTLYDTFNNKTIDSYSEAVVVLGSLQKAFDADNVVLLKTNNDKYKFSMSTPSLNGYTKEMFDIKKRAVADGTFIKAPNGNPTNLNERQWLQVRTKAFKEWFGDWTKITLDENGKVLNIPNDVSKVVDENGEPLVVYHGSRNNSFTIFDVSKNDKGKKGFFFTDSEIMASSYGKTRGFFLNSKDAYTIEGNGKNWNNLPIYTSDIAKNKIDAIRLHKNSLLLDIKEGKRKQEDFNFWNDTFYKYLDEYNNLGNSIKDKIRKLIIERRLNKFNSPGDSITSTRNIESVLELDKDDVNIIWKQITDYGPVFNREATRNMIANIPANVYMVTNPNNIKSATDNIGTFSNDNNNIYLANYDYKSPYQEEAYKIIKEVWNLGRELSPYEIESVNNRLRRLSDMAGDVPWFLRRSNAGNWYIAGYKNAPVTMAGYYSKTYNFRSNAISSEQFESMKDTTLRKEIFNGKDSITVTEALDAIEKRTPVLKPFIDMLRTSEYAKDVQIVLTKEGREFEYKNGKKAKAPGYYNPADNKIYIWENSAFMQVAGEHKADTTILHEILHSITTDALFVNPEFKNRITSLMDSVKQYYKDNFDNADEIISNIYGLTNEQEFLSEAFSNSTFINTLLSIPVSKKKSKLETVFDSFINAIKNLFHISNDSLYNDVVTLLQDIMKYGNERFEAQSYYDEYLKNINNNDFSGYDYENDLFLPAESINIYAGTNENTDLSNFAVRPYFDKPGAKTSLKFQSVEQGFQYGKFEILKQVLASSYTDRDEAWKNIIFQITNLQNKLLKLDRNKFNSDKDYGSALKHIGNTRLKAEDSDLNDIIDQFFAKKKVGNRLNWNEDPIASDIMKVLIKTSFEQNPQALQRLLATGDATLTHIQDKSKWGTEFPRLLMEVRSELAQERGITLNQQNNQQNGILSQKITFSTSTSNSYSQRTKENADWSDVTLALAIDFNTAGETLTAQQAGSKDKKFLGNRNSLLNLKDKHVPVSINGVSAEDCAKEIINTIKSKGLPTSGIKLNIAGNGIYSFKNFTQEQLNDYITEVLNQLRKAGITISAIRSGGQTGVDEAGIIAAQRLGIPAEVHTTSDWKFRGADGKDISDEKSFKDRFNINTSNQNEQTNKQPLTTQYTQLSDDEKTAVSDVVNPDIVNDEIKRRKPMSEYDRQYYDLYHSDKIGVEEIKYMANYAMRMLSTVVSILKNNPDMNEEYFGDMFKDMDFTKMERMDIIDTIGIEKLLNVVKEWWFNVYGIDGTESQLGDISPYFDADAFNDEMLEKYKVIYNNWKAFVDAGYQTLLQTEHIALTKVRKDDIKLDGVDESVDNEINGSAAELGTTESWQMGHQQVSSTASLSQDVRIQLGLLFMYDKNGNYVSDEYGFKTATYVNVDKAVSQLLYWTEGCETLDDMIKVLKNQAVLNPWLRGLIDENNGLLYKDKSFANKFFTNFRKQKVWYSATYKDGDKLKVKILNEKAIISDIINEVKLAYASGNISIVEGSKDKFKANKGNIEDIKTKLLEIRKQLNSINTASNQERTDIINDIIDKLVGLNSGDPGLLDNFGINKNLITNEILNNWRSHDYIAKSNITIDKIIREMSTICDTFSKQGKDEFNPFDVNSVANVYNSYKGIASALSTHIYEAVESSVYENSKMYYAYNNPSYLGTLITRLQDKARSNRTYEDFLKEEYLKYGFFCRNYDEKKSIKEIKDEDILCPMLRTLVKNDSARNVLKHMQMLNFDKIDYTEQDDLSYLKSLLAAFRFKNGMSNTGYYRIATLSDKPSSEFVRWYISSQDEIVTQMRDGIFLQEINRIKMLLDRATQKNIEKIKNYDIDEKTIKKNKELFNRVFDALSKRDEKTGVTNITVDDFAEILKKVKGSGVRFTYLEHLNELNKNKKEDAVVLQGIVNLVNNKDMSASQVSDFYEALDKKNNEFLDNLYTDEISEFEKLGLFETEEVKDDKGNVINIKFIHLGDYQEKSDFEKANKSIKVQQAKPKDRVGEIKNIMMNNMKARLKSFIINDCFVQMNLIELTSTDPAFFKNSNDFQKRNAQQHAPSIRMNISATFKNKKGADVKYSADGKSRAMYLKDYEIISELIEGVNAAINLKKNNPNTSEAEKVALDTIRSQIVNALEKVNVADAQGYSCPTSYRKKMGMLGQWNEDTDEVAYQRILSGNFNTDDLNVLWQPLKPFVYSQHSMSASSIFSKFMKVPVQHKNSEYVIFLADAIIRGNKDGKTNKLTALFDFMENSAYDGRIIYRNGKFYKDGNIVKADSVEEKEVISLLKSKGIRKPEEIYDGYVVKEGTYNGAGIDTIMFESACKVGLHGKLDINEKDSYDEILSTLNKAYSVDENGNRITNDEKGNRIYNENFVDTFDFKDYGIQQAVPQHFIDHEQLYGSQIRILGFSDIRKDAVFSGNRSGSEIQKRAQELVAANINTSLKELEYDLMLNTDLLKEKLTNIIEKAKKSKDTDPIEYLKKSLDSLYKNNKLTAKKANDIANAFDTNKSAKEILDSVDLTISEREKNEAISKELESAIKRDVKYGPDLLRACKINSETGRFEIPLNDPTQSIRTQQLLCSIIKSRISKQKIAGGPVVQLSAWGTIVGSDSLKVLHDENGRIVGGECYIPYPSEDVRKAMMKYDESGKFIGMMSIEEAKKANIIDEDMLKSIGYRIPTEDKYSMMPLKVVGFVPSTAGEVVVLPQEITALSGSDFDIDKLYIMMKSYVKYTSFNSDKFKKVFNSKTTKTISAKDNVNTFLSNVRSMGLEKAKELLGDNEFDNLIRDIVDNNSNEISDVKFRISNDNVDKNNNELIDLQYEVLTHQDTAIKFYNVGNFDEQKKVGKIITIAQSLPGVYSKNELEKKSIDELDEILDTVIPQKSIFRSSTQVYWHKQNMTAKALIGIFANNNTSHAFLNMQNIEYNFGDKGIVFNGNLFTRGKFDETLAFDGTYISKRIASFLAASVDAVKDPVLNFMNVNKSTANVAMLLARLGLSTSTIGMFLSQPIIRELVDTYEKKSSMGYVSLNNVIDEFRENKFKNKVPSLEEYLNSDKFTDEKLFKNLNLPEPDMEYQQLCLEMFSYLLEPSKDMGEMTFMTKFNSITNAAGPTIADTLSMERRINQFLSKNNGYGSMWFKGTKGILDKDNSPLLNAFYTSTMIASKEIFTNLFPHYTDAFNTLLNEYENESNTYVTADTINDLVNFYTLAAGTTLLKNNNKPVFDFTEERRKELISDGFMSNIVRGSFKNNKFISSISITKEEKCPVRTMVIRMGNYTADMKEQAKSSWGALMDSTEGKKIGLDVFYYNLMRSGFEFSPKTGLPLASVDVKQAVDGYTELLERVNSEGLDSIDSLTFIEQYKRNYYYKSGVVTTLKENKLAKVDGDTLSILSNDESKPSSIITYEGEYGPKVMHIIRYNNELYKHIKTTNNLKDFTIKYKKVSTLGVKNNFIEVDMNDFNIKTVFNIKQNAGSDNTKIGNAVYEYISKQQPLLSQALQSTSYNADVQKRINELQSTILDYRRMLTDLPLSKSEIIDTENKVKELQAELEKIKETQNICR